MPRVIFINRFYWPDETATSQLLVDLAEDLAARGMSVAVIASRPSRPGVPRSETRHGVQIERIGSTRSRGLGIAAKALDFVTFFFGALFALNRMVQKSDAVVALTDPPLIGVGTTFVAGFRGARAFHWIQDIYPEIACALTGHNELLMLRPLRNWAWKKAAACVTLGADMSEVVRQSGVPQERIHVVPNWAPAGLGGSSAEAVAAQRSKWLHGASFLVAYSGNLGRVHELDSILDVAEKLSGDREISFLFIGEGPRRKALELDASRRSLLNVHFLPPQPRESLSVALSAADVHLVTLRSGCENFVYPSKVIGIAAVGRPILFLGAATSEPARLIEQAGIGRAFSRSEAGAAAETLQLWNRSRDIPARLGHAAAKFAAQSNASQAAEVWTRLLNHA